MNKQTGLIIRGEERPAEQLQQVLAAVNPFLTVVTVSLAKAEDRLEAVVDEQKPEFIFVATDELDIAAPIIQRLRRMNRTWPVIAFSAHRGEKSILQLMRCGVREWLESPVSELALRETMERIVRELDELPVHHRKIGCLYSFVPSKPGSGASTVALHFAHACAENSGERVALVDLDLNCGTQAFMSGTEGGFSVMEATQYAERIDDALWDRMLVQTGNVDLLPSGDLKPGTRVELAQLHRLIGYLEGRYSTACVDLSGNWERYSIDVMERSTAVVQVCTTDFASLRQARRNMEMFDELGIRDKVHVVLNRATYHTGLDRRAVESILGVEPMMSLPNSFNQLQSALKESKCMESGSGYGQGIAKLSASLLKRSSTHFGGVNSEEAGKSKSKFDSLRVALRALGSRTTAESKEQKPSLLLR